MTHQGELWENEHRLPPLPFQLREHHPPDLAQTLTIRKSQHLLSVHSGLGILLTT